MNFAKRAFTSIIRRPGKSAILLILVFILGNIIAGAVSIQQAVTQTEASIRQGIGAVSTIELDYNKLMNMSQEEQQNMNYLPLSTIEELGKSPYVKYYDYNAVGYLNSDSLKPYQAENNESGNVVVSGNQGFSTKGVQYHEMLPFKEGNGKLLEGRTFTESEVKNGSKVALVTKQMAEANNLRIGDKITMKNNVYNYNNMPQDGSMPAPIASEEVELEIIGIYEPKQKVEKDDKTGMTSFMNEELINTIYVPNKVVLENEAFANAEMEKIGEKPTESFYQPVYVLNDANDLDAFRKEAEALIPDTYKVSDGNDQVASIAGPLLTIKWIAGIVLYVAVGATLVILSLLITLFLRDRKHEIGIYLSLGEKRVKVAMQIIIETVSIALIAITLALFSGNLLAQGISQTMLTNQLTAEQQQDNAGMIFDMPNGYESDMTKEDVADAYKVSLDGNVIIAFYVVGLGAVFISTLVPILYIVRLNPKKIML
ncbi:ABC transporter permease [Culicoidibacter larvae]|uniref:ABC transporter permease n=1 Tax=Culicoidibacter larvae TaxID=2579976 RepID=A0A5R8Q922_9FIRM|nr:ABC transporter permease [Culicoidibacter larvae]TLG71783.1 ABC transporter permease [Culicoidibacter larvae]